MIHKKLALEELNRLSAEEYQNAPKQKAILVLDDIRSMNNVGSAFRTADSFACQEICLVGITAQPPHREIHKTALGAEETVQWRYFSTQKECIEYLNGLGAKIAIVEQVEDSMMLQDFKVNSEELYAFVFGNEVFGVTDEFIENADYFLEIPQFGTKHSLNVSVTMGIVVWDYFLKLNRQY